MTMNNNNKKILIIYQRHEQNVFIGLQLSKISIQIRVPKFKCHLFNYISCTKCRMRNISIPAKKHGIQRKRLVYDAKYRHVNRLSLSFSAR